MRTKSCAEKHFWKQLDALGLPHRRVHDLRRTFISLAREDGADKDLLRRGTHQPPKDVMELYTTVRVAEALRGGREAPPPVAGARKDEARGEPRRRAWYTAWYTRRASPGSSGGLGNGGAGNRIETVGVINHP